MSQAKVREKVGKPATEVSSQLSLLLYYCSYVITVKLLQFSYIELGLFRCVIHFRSNNNYSIRMRFVACLMAKQTLYTLLRSLPPGDGTDKH